ncbi:MAG TPA: hypothetical protein VHQ90_00155 [Thermoanaerobaculia bacterium]|nr:hypothetical protein [Thermoanaerobaculia bacterium]
MTENARANQELIVKGELLSTALGATEAMVLLVNELPEASGDATERILAAILTAQTAEEVNAIWDAQGIELYLDVPLRIDWVERAPSEFEDGIGVYVVIHGHNPRTDQPVTVTTGSINVIGILIQAVRNDWLPMMATPRGPKRVPKSGRTPYRLELGPLRLGR